MSFSSDKSGICYLISLETFKFVFCSSIDSAVSTTLLIHAWALLLIPLSFDLAESTMPSNFDQTVSTKPLNFDLAVSTAPLRLTSGVNYTAESWLSSVFGDIKWQKYPGKFAAFQNILECEPVALGEMFHEENPRVKSLVRQSLLYMYITIQNNTLLFVSQCSITLCTMYHSAE